MKTLLLALAMLCLEIATAATPVSIRVAQQPAANGAVYAAVEILPTDASVILADQNYRLYYDAATLALDVESSYSTLSTEQYSDLEVVEHIEGVDAQRGQLAFDAELGFVNFTITLADMANGGIEITNDGWYRVAVLAFDRMSDDAAELVWSRAEMTDEYATAYVELTEWVAPYEAEAMEIVEHVDGEMVSEITATINTQIGPNPTADFVRVYVDTPQTAELNVTVINMNGQVVISTTIAAGATMTQIEMADLVGGMYSLQITDTFGTQLHSEQVSKVSF